MQYFSKKNVTFLEKKRKNAIEPRKFFFIMTTNSGSIKTEVKI